LVGDLGNALVDLTAERLVAGQTLPSLPHGGIVQIVSGWQGLAPAEWAGPSNRYEWGLSAMLAEDVFRDANERIAEKAHELELEQPIPFLCECSDKGCFARLFLVFAEYEKARSDPERYLTIPGHEIAGAVVIASDDRLALAEKI
jgi:hypothetical protein